MRINYNLSAQLANVSLKRADNRMTSSLERLSSGYKINKAADDSAGMAISNKMRSQIRSLEQSSRNAGDGNSIIQTAEGALTEIESLLQRTRELSVQSANDTYTVDDRYSIQKEVNELLDEIDRIASTTDFNGTNLLDGTCSRVVTADDIGLANLGVSSTVLSGEYSLTVDTLAEPATGTLSFVIPTQGTSTIKINDATITIDSDDTNDTVYDKVLGVCNMMEITIDSGKGTNSLNLVTNAVGSDQRLSLRSTNAGTDVVTFGKDVQVTLDTASSQFDAKQSVRCSGDNITISDRTGFEMRLVVQDGINAGDTRNLTVYDTGSMKLQIGANEHQNIDIDFAEVSCRALMLREEDGDNLQNVCTHEGASRAITAFDNAIRFISDYRSNLGAMENRLNSTISSLDVTTENITEAMARIRDTDMAEAMTEYTQESVLSQAATAMLAQANNRPQQVMSLLQS